MMLVKHNIISLLYLSLLLLRFLANCGNTLKFRVRPRKQESGNSKSKGSSKSSTPLIQLLQYHSFPLPRVTGSRSNLKVMLPVPDYVYTMLPMEQVGNPSI